MSVAYPPIVDPPPSTTSSVEEAREAFEIELATFKLLLRKTRMVCEAESKQQVVYRSEKDRIGAFELFILIIAATGIGVSFRPRA